MSSLPHASLSRREIIPGSFSSSSLTGILAGNFDKAELKILQAIIPPSWVVDPAQNFHRVLSWMALLVRGKIKELDGFGEGIEERNVPW